MTDADRLCPEVAKKEVSWTTLRRMPVRTLLEGRVEAVW